MLGTLIAAIGLWAKRLPRPAEIKLDLMHDKIWVMVKNQGWRSMIPCGQIARLTDRLILFEGWLPACLEREVGTLV